MTALKDCRGIEDHCISCHEDHDGGYAPLDECWDSSMHPEPTPPEKQYCCCSQSRIAETTTPDSRGGNK